MSYIVYYIICISFKSFHKRFLFSLLKALKGLQVTTGKSRKFTANYLDFFNVIDILPRFGYYFILSWGEEIDTWMNYEKHHIFSQITEEAELRKYNPNQIVHT